MLKHDAASPGIGIIVKTWLVVVLAFGANTKTAGSSASFPTVETSLVPVLMMLSTPPPLVDGVYLPAYAASGNGGAADSGVLSESCAASTAGISTLLSVCAAS